MISLRLALIAFVLYFLCFFAYYRWFFKHRIYLLLLNESSYMEHYIAKLPHMRERPGERRGMEDFLMAKRRNFMRSNRNFVFAATAIFVALLIIASDKM